MAPIQRPKSTIWRVSLPFRRSEIWRGAPNTLTSSQTDLTSLRLQRTLRKTRSASMAMLEAPTWTSTIVSTWTVLVTTTLQAFRRLIIRAQLSLSAQPRKSRWSMSVRRSLASSLSAPWGRSRIVRRCCTLPSRTSVPWISRRHLAILRFLIARSSTQESLVKVLETRTALKASLELVSRRSMLMLMSRPELRAGLPLRPQATKASEWSGTCRTSKSR